VSGDEPLQTAPQILRRWWLLHPKKTENGCRSHFLLAPAPAAREVTTMAQTWMTRKGF